MLSRIEIQDFALIEHAVLTPGPGLLILTGETGAGKSILIDAISALGGGRVSREVIRHGQNKATVEAIFQNPGRFLPPELMNQLGLEEDASDRPDHLADDAGEDLILSREIQASGKSVCRVNGRLVSLSVLKDLSVCLIDIHGQHDQQAIFQTDTHLLLLDRFGSETVSHALQEYQEVLREYQQVRHQLEELGQDPAERARQLDMLQFQTREIETARIKPNEDEALVQRRKIVANAGKIRDALSEAYDLLDGEAADTILSGLGQVVNRMELAARHLPDLVESQNQVQESLYTLQNVAGEIRAALETVESDPGELEQLDERLDFLFRLKKKYGGTLAAVQQFYLNAQQKLEQLSNGEARYEQLQQHQQKLKQLLLKRGSQLSDIRRLAAQRLEQEITRELGDLGMKGVRFAVQLTPSDPQQQHFARSGLDQVEFLISANPGEPLKPLTRIASGGEASRIMLAVKTILAQADRTPVLIFDEIDTGVSGRTAGRVAAKLRELAKNRQVFCITHLAQIAAMADRHLLIEKIAAENQTRTQLVELNDLGRETELARLLSGGIGDEAAHRLASQLLLQAREINETAVPDDTVPAASAGNRPAGEP